MKHAAVLAAAICAATAAVASYASADEEPAATPGKLTFYLSSATELEAGPSGEAPSAAEVTDARVGADGVTYASLGTAIRTQNTNLKAALQNKTFYYSWLDDKYISKFHGGYYIDSGMKATTLFDISDELVLVVSGVGERTIGNAFYDSGENFISSFTMTQGVNYIDIPENAKYAAISGSDACVEHIHIYKRSFYSPHDYDVSIASISCPNAIYADYVTLGTDDDELINKLINNNRVKSVFFVGGSTFNLRAPIITKAGLKIKSNGAVFTQSAMQTASVVNVNIDANDNTMIIASSDVAKFKTGQYLYFEMDNGSYSLMPRIISNITETTNNRYILTFTTGNGTTVDSNKNAILKTANPCFVVPGVADVEINGVYIDWNVSQNPIQTYNPWYLQEGISIQANSSNIRITNCNIKNGGRRGICSTDSVGIVIDGCVFDNWHEHAIDIYNSEQNGSTRENPKTNECIITNCIISNCKMQGIQLHRGSGCIVSNCISHDNTESGIGMTSYAHDNTIENCTLYRNGGNISIRGNSYNITIIGNHIFGTTSRSAQIGIVGDCKNIMISNNHIFDTIGQAISSVGGYSENVTIQGNKINVDGGESGLYPIAMYNCKFLMCIANTIKCEKYFNGEGIHIGLYDGYNVVKNNIIYNAKQQLVTGEHNIISDNTIIIAQSAE